MKKFSFLKLLYQKGVSQSRLCQTTNTLSEPRLSRIINGFTIATPQEITALAKALDISESVIRLSLGEHVRSGHETI